MYCRECKAEVPDAAVTCVVCAQKRSRQGMRMYQRQPVLRTYENDGALTTRRTAGGVRHVQMFGYSHFAFCGVPLYPGNARDVAGWDALSRICPGCREELQAILSEAQAAKGAGAS